MKVAGTKPELLDILADIERAAHDMTDSLESADIDSFATQYDWLTDSFNKLSNQVIK